MKPLSEEWTRTVDALVKIVGVLAIVVGGGWTVYQYFQNRNAQLAEQQEARQQQRLNELFEERRPFLQERLELYLEIASAVGTITTSKNQSAVAKAKESFSALYSGPVRLVASLKEEAAMDRFAVCLEKTTCQSQLKTIGDGLTSSLYQAISGDWVPSQPTGLKARVQ